MCSAASAPALLEEGTVELLDKVGAGARAHREGLVHDGVELAFGGRAIASTCKAPTGKTVMIYGQTEVTLDLMNAREGGRAAIDLSRPPMSRRTISTPTIRGSRYVKDGVTHEIACDFIAGCDGFHGVSRASVKPDGDQDLSSGSIRSAGSASCPRRRRSRTS